MKPEQVMVAVRIQAVTYSADFGICVFIAGVFWEPSVQTWRSEAVPDPGDPRDRPVWTVEDWSLQELHAQCAGGPGGPNPGTGAALDPSVPCAEVRQWMEH